MKTIFLLLVAVAIGAGIYGYNRNPKECGKLGTDLMADVPTIASDVKTIFTPVPSGKEAPGTTRASDATR